MTHTTAELEATRELYRIIRTARRIRTLALVALLAGAFLYGMLFSAPWAPRPAHATTVAAAPASPIKGTVDVCAVEVPKSWTKGLQRKANRALQQRVRVHRVTEWTLADQPCDLFLWTTESSRQLGLSPADGEMFEVLATAKKKKQRPAAVVRALKAAGIR